IDEQIDNLTVVFIIVALTPIVIRVILIELARLIGIIKEVLELIRIISVDAQVADPGLKRKSARMFPRPKVENRHAWRGYYRQEVKASLLVRPPLRLARFLGSKM